jgi:hypothetical protein
MAPNRVVDYVDRIEHHTLITLSRNETGKVVGLNAQFDQIIYWRLVRQWSGYVSHVVDWRMCRCREEPTPEAIAAWRNEFNSQPFIPRVTWSDMFPIRNPRNGKWEARFFDHVSGCHRLIISDEFVRSATFDDPEVDDRVEFPSARRQRLSGSSVNSP